MFVIFYKDGHQGHVYDENFIMALDWSNVIMVINMSNVDY